MNEKQVRLMISIITIMFLLSMLNVISTDADFEDVDKYDSGFDLNSNILEPSEEEKDDSLDSYFLNDGTRSNQPHLGGTWMDSFEDDSNIEELDQITFSETGLRLADDEILQFGDNFTGSEIDINKWKVEEGVGTVLTSSDVLIAFKQGWNQDTETYIESHRNWEVPRRLDFKWNSIHEGGLSGYEHEIDVYRSSSNNDRIWISIEGNYHVKLHSSGNSEVIGPPFTLNENTWYEFSCRLTPYSASLKIEDNAGNVVNFQNLSHDFSKKGNIRFLFAKTSLSSGNFDVRLDNVTLFSGYEVEGEFTTKPIFLPSGNLWDSLSIQKNENPPETSISFDILDSETFVPIAGFRDINADGFDISQLNISIYQEIRLRGSFKGSIESTPELNWVAVSWHEENSYFDDFIDDFKIAETSSVIVSDSKIQLESGFEEGYVLSDIIEIPANNYWNVLILDKIEPAENSYITLTIIDEQTGVSLINFKNLFEENIELRNLDPISYPRIRLKAEFYGYSSFDPVLSAWSINWTENSAPVILDFQGPSAMYRGDTEFFSIFVSDSHQSSGELNVSLLYRLSSATPSSGLWSNEFINKLEYRNGLWSVEFSPPATAETGTYSFRIVISDFFGIETIKILENILVILNKPPGAPQIILSPAEPLTTSDLKCFVSPPSEMPESNVTIIYRWYRNSHLQPGLQSDTVSSAFTKKYDVWRCEVAYFDGVDESLAASAEVFIGNTPPRAVGTEVRIQITEDAVNKSSEILDKYFTDADLDLLNYTILPADYVKATYDDLSRKIFLNPEPDWNGITSVIVYASDDSSDISKSFLIEVLPINDAPVIASIGSQVLFGHEDEDIKFKAIAGSELRLKVSARDIDGDTLVYSTNRTDGESNDDLPEVSIDKNSGLIIFQPQEDSDGKVLIEISVTDNNGSIIQRSIIIEVKSQKEDSFSQLLLSTNWMIIVVGLIVIAVVSYGYILIRNKVKAYMRKKYREKLKGTGRFYANYPIALTTKQYIPGRYPKESGEFSAFIDPYRTALYSYKQEQLPPAEQKVESSLKDSNKAEELQDSKNDEEFPEAPPVDLKENKEVIGYTKPVDK